MLIPNFSNPIRLFVMCQQKRLTSLSILGNGIFMKLYRHFNEDGVLLYVGVSLSVVCRSYKHGKSPWADDISLITIEKHKTKRLALEAEKLAIKNESPLFNELTGPIGRPKIKYTQEHLDAAKAIWRDIHTYRKNKDAVYAMNSQKNAKKTGAACVKPWTVRRALARFKASGRLTPKESSDV